MDGIFDTVCSVTGLSPDQLRSKSRAGSLPVARKIFLSTAHAITDEFTGVIAERVNRGHCMVFHSIKTLSGDYAYRYGHTVRWVDQVAEKLDIPVDTILWR